jgi:hypothetical protein
MEGREFSVIKQELKEILLAVGDFYSRLKT